MWVLIGLAVTGALGLLAVVASILATYTAGYFWLGSRIDAISLAATSTGGERLDGIERNYPHACIRNCRSSD